MFKGIFHIHTHNSYDSNSKIEKIIDLSVKNGIDFLVISDHDTLKGSIQAKSYAKRKGYNINIPIACEYLTDIGDVIVFGVDVNFKGEFNHKKLLEKSKKSGGYNILVHPYHHHNLEKTDFTNIDYIEVFNSRCSNIQNEKAIQLAENKGKKQIIGSDAHLIREIFNTEILFDNIDFVNSSNIELSVMKKTKKSNIRYSQIIKSVKKRNIKLFIINIIFLIYFKVKELF